MRLHGTTTRERLRVSMITAALTAIGVLSPPAVAAQPAHLDPAALARGSDPAVAYLVGDTVRDGTARIPATKRGDHQALWAVSRGYLLRDVNVGPRHLTRIVYISSSGARRLVTRSRGWVTVAVSATGNRVAVQRSSGSNGLRTIISVSDPATGQVIARRSLRLANLVAINDQRALVGRRARWHHPATVWWDWGRDQLTRIAHQAAVGADIRHDKVVFDRTPVGEFCNRVAVLSDPSRTLWSSCDIYPHQWSPDGRHAIATYSFFDAAGTAAWWVLGGRSGARQAKVTGRLDKNAVWEDNGHFLTLAQSDAGRAAIVRCDLTGSCQRASRLWNVPVPSDPSIYYARPPVVLASP